MVAKKKESGFYYQDENKCLEPMWAHLLFLMKISQNLVASLFIKIWHFWKLIILVQ